jgi:hypothetical protein
MRLGFLGPRPAHADDALVEEAADFLLHDAKVDRAIYLGDDDALERVVGAWATRLVGDDPTDRGAWRKARDLAAKGTVAEIDAFVAGQRTRLRLRALESLPQRIWRTIEMVGDRVAVLVHDKALLDEEDILSASLLVYGKSELPFTKKIGTRWFMTPGELNEKGGICVLDDAKEEIEVSLFDCQGALIKTDTLPMPRASTMRVQGA